MGPVLRKVLITPELARDPRFDSNATRSANRQQLEPILQRRLVQLNSTELIALLDTASIANATVNTIAGLHQHPQLAHARAGPRWPHPRDRSGAASAASPMPTRQRWETYRHWGAHTEDVLAWLGYAQAETRRCARTV